MRFAIAIAVLALSGIAFILGIGQRTFLAPAAEIVVSTEQTGHAGYAVIPAEAFTARKGEPSVVVRASDAFAAIGAQRDVDAWIAPIDHSFVTAVAAEAELQSELVPAVLPEVTDDEANAATAEGETEPDAAEDAAEDSAAESSSETGDFDPRGSDLWLVEARAGSGEVTLRMPVEIAADQSVLIAASPGSSLENGVSIAWTQDRSTPFAGPLIVTGAVLAVVGAVLFILAIDHDRRGLGPSRGRKGLLPGIRGALAHRKETRKLKRIAAPALVLTAALGLTACSPSYWPDFTPSDDRSVTVVETPDAALAPVPITPAQIDRIIADVAAVSEQADRALDAEILEARFGGDALAQRAANYQIRSQVPTYELVPPQITGEELGYELVQSTEGWPRTVFVAVGSVSDRAGSSADAEADAEQEPDAEAGAESETVADASPSLALIMTQGNPHENYRVSRVINLRGGIAMPEAAPAEEGTALLAPDLQTLVLPPGELGTAFAALLQGGPDVEEAALFDIADDPLLAGSGFAWQQQAQQKADADGTSVQYSVTVHEGSEPLTALSTGVGGGLVAVTVIEERLSDTAGGSYRLRAEGAVSALSGLSGQQERIVSEVAHQLLFFVPSKASGEKIQLLGATSELVGARN